MTRKSETEPVVVAPLPLPQSGGCYTVEGGVLKRDEPALNSTSNAPESED
jgi:hypothetical protein